MVCSEWSTVGKPTRVFAQELGLLFCPRFYYDYIRNNISEYDIYSNMNIHIINILWVTTQTQLFLTPPPPHFFDLPLSGESGVT